MQPLQQPLRYACGVLTSCKYLAGTPAASMIGGLQAGSSLLVCALHKVCSCSFCSAAPQRCCSFEI